MTQLEAHIYAVCPDQPGPGGFAAVVQYEDTEVHLSGGHPDTDSKRIHLTAAIETLKYLRLSFPNQTDGRVPAVINTLVPLHAPLTNPPTRSGPPPPNLDLWCQIHTLTSDLPVHWRTEPHHPTLQRCRNPAHEQIRAATAYAIPWSTASMPFPDAGPDPHPTAAPPTPQPMDRLTELELEVTNLRHILQHTFALAGQSKTFNDYKVALSEFLLQYSDLYQK